MTHSAPADDTRYNGWRNYETWSVALIVDNDQDLYHTRHRMAQRAWLDAQTHPDHRRVFAKLRFTRHEYAVVLLAQRAKEWVTEAVDLRLVGRSGDWWLLINQLVGGALSEVDWHELATNWLSDTDHYPPDAP